MVNSKKVVVVVGILILMLIVSVQFSFAAKGGDKGGGGDEPLGGSTGIICTIDLKTACATSGKINLLGLSDTSNAHGEFLNYGNPGDDFNYPYALCCDFNDENNPISWGNVVPDPGFEGGVLQAPYEYVIENPNNIIYTGKGYLEFDSSKHYSGTKSLKYTSYALEESYTMPYWNDQDAALSQASPGEIWNSSIWVKSETGQTNNVRIFIFALNSEYGLAQSGSFTSTTTFVGNSWQKISAQYTLPAETSYVSTRVDNQGENGAIIYLDDWDLQNSEEVCSNGRKIVGLSYPTNAHAEIPTPIADFYGPLQYNGEVPTVNVCYDNSDFNCVESQPGQGCPVGKEAILSLSDYGNAHLGLPGTYDQKICCDVDFITENYCGNSEVDQDNEECDNGINCIMEYPNQCQCYYGYSSTEYGTGCYLSAAGDVHWSENEIGELQLLEKDVIIGQTKVYLILLDQGMAGHDYVPVSFEIKENDFFNDDDITILSSSFTDGKAIAEWTVSLEDIENAKLGGDEEEFEFYFKALYNNNDDPNYETGNSDDLIVTITSSPLCETRSRCMDYSDEFSCESDSDTCQLADNSLEGIDCSNPSINCYCEWNSLNNVCFPAWSDGPGSCNYEEIVDDDCEDMLLTYEWIVEWVGDGPQDPLCVNGETTVPCPAQIQLTFFSYYNLIIIIALMIIIYVWMNHGKKVKKRNVKKRKRK